MTTINIYDCGCVSSRPKEQSCRAYGTRWRVYTSIGKDGNAVKIILRCRDCGRIRHFTLTGLNPVLIQYSKGEDTNDEEI